MVAPAIRFCRLPDGSRLAYAELGAGEALVMTPGWVSHLELNWPRFQPVLGPLSKHLRIIRYDKRGTGLSDRAAEDVSLRARLADFEALVAWLGLDRFALYAASAGGPMAIAYAAMHPQQVSRLVLYGTFARGDGVTGKPQTMGALLSLARAESGLAWTAFMDLYLPGAPAAERDAFAHAQGASAGAEVAAALLEAMVAVDVRDLLPRVVAPTLVAHARGDRAVPFEYGRELAAGIPDARFLALESDRHILDAAQDQQLWDGVRDFLLKGAPTALSSTTPAASAEPAAPLSDREAEVLRLLARGATNQQMADQLFISLSTVAHHVGSILDKTGAANRTQAAAYAHRHGLG